MKLLYCLALCLVYGSAVQAQDYRIFRKGLTYQLSERASAGDTTHVLRLTTATQQGADSVFRFTARTGRIITAPALCSRYGLMQRPENMFGATLTIRATGEQVLTATNGRTLTLWPRRAVGTPWTAVANGITAQVSGRVLGTVLGQPDSLTTITLSDGQALTLSKTYGLVSGPTLGRYLNPRLPQKQLTLTALPEARLGAAQTGPSAVYDFQPGDVFLRREDWYGRNYVCPQQTMIRDSIISRRYNPVGDSVIYRIARQTLMRYCVGTATNVGFTLSPPSIVTLAITADYGVGVASSSALTNNWELRSSIPFGPLHYAVYRTSRFNGRPVQSHSNFMRCTTAPVADTTLALDAAAIDAGSYSSTVAGLGQVYLLNPNVNTLEMNLLGYRKGAETWGQIPQLAPLAVRAARPSARLAVYPVPCEATLTVSFELSRAQPVQAELHDALGRVVLSAPATTYASGPQTLRLATAALPAGCYQLHLQLTGDKRTEVLRVLKQ